MPNPQVLTDEDLATLAKESEAGTRRLIIVASDRPAAVAWAAHRGIKRWFFAEDAGVLFGLNDPDSSAVVLVKGHRQHKQWNRLRPRLSVVGAVVPIYTDDLPETAKPVAPTIGGAHLLHRGVQQMRPEDGQGDTFRISAAGAGVGLELRREQVEQVVDLMVGYLEGEALPDPALERFEEIKALVESTGDIYGREAS